MDVQTTTSASSGLEKSSFCERSTSVFRKHGFWAGVIIAAFLTFNLTQLDRYGMSWDETLVMERGRQTVALLTGLVRPDAEEQFEFSAVHFHPPFYSTCNYLVAEYLVRFAGWKPVAAGHLLNLIVASFGLAVIFFLGKLMFNSRVGLVALIFMIGFPRFTAHAHFNAKDIPVMVFGSLTLLMLYLAVKSRRRRFWILGGLAFAWSVTSKLDGLFLLPIFLIPWVVVSLKFKTEQWVSDIRRIEWFIYASIFFVLLFWPALWLNPLHFISSVVAFSGGFRTTELSYLGKLYPLNDLPWHYVPMHLIAVTPVVMLMLLGFGVIRSAGGMLKQREHFEYALIWSWILIPLFARMIPGTVQYDGMRHVFLIVPALALLAGVGADLIWTRWLHGTSRIAACAICASGLGLTAWQSIQAHPYQAYYVNEAVRIAVPGERIADCYDFKGWGGIFVEGVRWLNENAEPHSTVALPHDDYLLDRYRWREDIRILEPEDARSADYVLIGGWRGDLMSHFRSAPRFQVELYDAVLLRIYADEAQ